MRQFLSPYLYCANNPVYCIDPSGLFSFAPQDTSKTGFGGGTDMWGRNKFDPFNGLFIPYHERPGGAAVEGYGNSEYGQFMPCYIISYGHNYLIEYQGMIETYTFWIIYQRNGQEFTWYNNPRDRYPQEYKKPLSEMSEHERTMANPIVRKIHRAQWRFLRGTIEFMASGLQRLGGSLSTVGYAASITGTGTALASFGNLLQYTGVGIDVLLDLKDRKFRKAGYNIFTTGIMYGVGRLSALSPEPSRAIFNLTLIPFEATLSQGYQSLSEPKK